MSNDQAERIEALNQQMDEGMAKLGAALERAFGPAPRKVYGYCIFCGATLFDERPYCGGHWDDDI